VEALKHRQTGKVPGGDPQSMIRNSLYYKELLKMGYQQQVLAFSTGNS
jgi:hypothetical protein